MKLPLLLPPGSTRGWPFWSRGGRRRSIELGQAARVWKKRNSWRSMEARKKLTSLSHCSKAKGCLSTTLTFPMTKRSGVWVHGGWSCFKQRLPPNSTVQRFIKYLHHISSYIIIYHHSSCWCIFIPRLNSSPLNTGDHQMPVRRFTGMLSWDERLHLTPWLQRPFRCRGLKRTPVLSWWLPSLLTLVLFMLVRFQPAVVALKTPTRMLGIPSWLHRLRRSKRPKPRRKRKKNQKRWFQRLWRSYSSDFNCPIPISIGVKFRLGLTMQRKWGVKTRVSRNMYGCIVVRFLMLWYHLSWYDLGIIRKYGFHTSIYSHGSQRPLTK